MSVSQPKTTTAKISFLSARSKRRVHRETLNTKRTFLPPVRDGTIYKLIAAIFRKYYLPCGQQIGNDIVHRCEEEKNMSVCEAEIRTRYSLTRTRSLAHRHTGECMDCAQQTTVYIIERTRRPLVGALMGPMSRRRAPVLVRLMHPHETHWFRSWRAFATQLLQV